MRNSALNLSGEWLEADGLGGFASGTVGGNRTRRYHALLLQARNPPTDRYVLVNGLEVWLETANGNVYLSTQDYVPNATFPEGYRRLTSFSRDPWPTWRWQLDDGRVVEQEIFVSHGRPTTVIAWRLSGNSTDARLCVRPLVSGRDYHALHRENDSFNFLANEGMGQVTWTPYIGVPSIKATTNGIYQAAATWYRQFAYRAEQERGLDCVEDLASPGIFSWKIGIDSKSESDSSLPAIMILSAETEAAVVQSQAESADAKYAKLRLNEMQRRREFSTPAERAADAYIVRRGDGKTIVAGYPWFADWGRDTFIAMRGLCLATGRLEDAGEMLQAWTTVISQGMLPNRFPDQGDTPEYNSVDASLWFIVASDEYLRAAKAAGSLVSAQRNDALIDATRQILDGYATGTRYGIRADDDGLLRAGQPGVQLTWMDAKVGDWVVTPRIGKPVEIQALWLNALAIGATMASKWESMFGRALDSFRDKFWNPQSEALYDVVDVDHSHDVHDASMRPNQILAIGGLPLTLLDDARAQSVVDQVERQLYTPLGLRTLAPGSPSYAPNYCGDVWTRDGAYHQGTVWPWLLGPFVEAWLRVRGAKADAIQLARERFLTPLRAHLDEAGLGHISEIADAEFPHRPCGCPFQAWSLGEFLRLDRIVLKPPAD